MVLLFKSIAPPSQFPATIASGAPPRPNHAVFKAELVYVSKPFGGARGGGGGYQKSAPPACMQAYYNRVSSLPKGLIVADFLMHTPLLAIEQSSEHDKHDQHDKMH